MMFIFADDEGGDFTARFRAVREIIASAEKFWEHNSCLEKR